MYNAPLLGNSRCHGNRIMADMSRLHDGIWPPKLRRSPSIGRRVMAFRIFSNMAAVPAILNFKNFNIWSRDCHYGPNLLLLTKFHQNWFAHSASRRDNCRMFNALLLGNGIAMATAVARQRQLPWQPQRGGHVENMMGCDHPSCVPVGPLVGDLWHFEYFPTWRPSTILNFKIFIFDHVTVTVVLICCCIPNFIKLIHAFGLQTPKTAECIMRRCYAMAVAMPTAS